MAQLSGAERLAAPCCISEKRATCSSGEDLIATVDDDYYARGGLSAFVDSLGHTSSAFASEHYFSSDVALGNAYRISDVLLPGVRGAGLQIRLIADGYRILVIVIIACYDDNTRARVVQTGAVGYLAKPLREAVLVTNEEGGTRMTLREWLIVVGLTALTCAVICNFKGHRKGYELAQRLAPLRRGRHTTSCTRSCP